MAPPQLRLHCFRNGDWERKDVGFIHHLNSSDQSSSLNALKISATKILFPFLFEEQSGGDDADQHQQLLLIAKIRIFTKYGSEIKRVEELRDDDTLFFSCFNEDFMNRTLEMNYQIKQMAMMISNQNNNTSSSTTSIIESSANDDGSTKESKNESMTYSITILSLSTKKELVLSNNDGKSFLTSSTTVDDLKRCILNSAANKEVLLGRSDYPLKFTDDFILVHKGSELQDQDQLLEKLFHSSSNGNMKQTMATVYMVLKKPVYYVKLVMEGGRLVIVDNDAIGFTSHISDLKNYVEKRLRMNFTNKELILLWNQEKLTGSECLGNVFPSKSTASLTFI